ncbi:hypothetical protein K6U06_07645 [Acidiferrimicrobium sp. IK]|uniref:hypothetical protein n=1 Tax=Acidiferrimicrobium sp. IK TaxID=2871700 RepID=UPI0021CAE34D|nr:hypothetical protein [Acidiferrimicrobium sp. IK]MCU4184230.1 hypothetical protein [Acidiferrimicrobium sp. IK]
MAQQLPLIESRTDTDNTRPSTARRATRSGAGPRPGSQSRASRGARAFAVRPGVTDGTGVLIEIPAVDWHIDEHTKEVGLAGVAAARQALAAAAGRGPRLHGRPAAA